MKIKHRHLSPERGDALLKDTIVNVRDNQAICDSEADFGATALAGLVDSGLSVRTATAIVLTIFYTKGYQDAMRDAEETLTKVDNLNLESTK